MQIIRKRRTDDSKERQIFAQQIYAVGEDERELWNVCDKALMQIRQENVMAFYRDDKIDNEVIANVLKEFLGV